MKIEDVKLSRASRWLPSAAASCLLHNFGGAFSVAETLPGACTAWLECAVSGEAG